jgi:DMSO/TMAO reductase YedYZ molybdopterin-dependent catalytic subunit
VTVDDPQRRGPAGGRAVAARGALAGILTGGLALGIAQLVAGLISSASSPVVAVGELSINFTPPPVKNFAISAFGSHDKQVLVGGILIILALFAAGIGLLALRRVGYGMAGLAVFVLVGLVAALSQPNSQATDALPTLLGGAIASIALRRLIAAAAQAPPATPLPRPAPPARPARPTAPPRPSAPGAPEGWTPPTWLRTGDSPAPDSPASDSTAPDSPAPDSPAPDRPAPRPAPRPPAPRPVARPAAPRRSFLATSAVVAGGAVVAGVGGKLLAERGNVAAAQKALRIPQPVIKPPALPAGTSFKIPGLSSFITPNSQFYRVDTAIVLPEIPPSSWSLRVHGLVAKEIMLTFDELVKRPLIEDYITLTCVSNPVSGPYVGNAKWLGASLRSLLREAGIKAGADQLLCTSSDGFTSGTPVQTAMDGRDAMLAVAMNGTALPVEHGFPVRMVVPGLYGYVSACKWITDIEVTTYAAARSYWSVRGWDAQAPIKTESRIDVPTGNSPLKAGQVSVAGVAWAQHKGIAAVEVRVDRGPWHEARLAAVPDIDTWRQWAWEWPATPGNHLLEARATDKTGYTQTALQAPPEPNGATGYPLVQVSVNG